MPKGGRIINIGSVASKVGIPGLPIYGASKAALDNLAYTWAREVNDPKHATTIRIDADPS